MEVKVNPAAFGRLCVETYFFFCGFFHLPNQPPSGGCVLKPQPVTNSLLIQAQPPSGGCVLKLGRCSLAEIVLPSRLRAAVC